MKKMAPRGAINGANWRHVAPFFVDVAPIGDFRDGVIFPTRKMWTWRH